jgi:membrane associated rhomboid family serine protease
MPACAKCGSPLQVNEEGIAPVLCDRCAGVAVSRARKSIYTGTMRDYPVTAALAAINIGVFVAMVFVGGSLMGFSSADLVRWGANWGVRTLGGEYWRLLSAAFVHANLIHLAFNMWWLFFLGRLSERLFGRWQTAVIYLLTGVGGSLLSLAWEPTRLSVGASGAIFGLAGAILSGVRFGELSITAGEKRSIFINVVLFSAFSFFMGLRGNTDNMCHLGGFVTGLIIGVPLAVPSSSRSKHTLVQSVTLLATAVLLVVAGGQLVLAHGQMFKVETLLRRQDFGTAIQTLEKITASNPDNEEALLKLGAAYELTRQPERAVAVFEQAAKLNPNSGKIQANLGHAYLVNRQIDKAIAKLEEAVKTDPGNGDALLFLGYAYQENHQREKAIAAFEQAIKVDPEQDDARAQLKELRGSTPETENPAK